MMGLFNKTDEEIKKEEIDKKIRLLISEIQFKDMNPEVSNYFVNYLERIRRGYPNDFGDLDTLFQVVTKLINDYFEDCDDLDKHFNEVISSYRIIAGDSEDKKMKDIFVEHFVGKDGCLYRGLFDQNMYSTFSNKNDYFDILNVIMSDELFCKHFNEIQSYILSVSKYCLNQDVLKRDILSYLNGFYDCLEGDYSKYSGECLEMAKRRVGVYNISPKDLATVDSKFRKMDSFLDQMDTYMTGIKEEKKAINTLIDNGKKEIKSESDASIKALRNMIEREKELLKQKLDEYLVELEGLLSDKSDETFREIIETYKKQVQDFRNLFRTYSVSASKDLLSIQKATEESVLKLQNYVSNEPQLKELLSKAQEQNAVREKIIQLVDKEEQLMKVGTEVEQVSVPGYENRVMVPYSHMVLPTEIPRGVIKALDENIDFSLRKEEVFRRIEERKRKGEIFHKKVPQIAIDIMEGDWPYLWGPSGTGKSYMAKQVASVLGMELTKAGKITEPYSVLGYNDPQGRYQITPSFIAALYGNLLFLDELDNGNPDTQVVLNDIYSELLNKLDNPNELCEVTFGTDVNVDINPNFRMLAAGNTSGEGENEAFSSRGKMDESIQERMTPIFVDYDDRVEEQILKDYPEWYKFFIEFRNACTKYSNGIGHESAQGITTTRDAAAIKKYIKHDSKSLDQVIAERFVQIKDSEYRKAIGNQIAKVYGIDYQQCKDVNFNGSLEAADGKVLAKKFITICKNGVN